MRQLQCVATELLSGGSKLCETCDTQVLQTEQNLMAQIIVAVAIRGQRPVLDIAAPEAVRRMVSRCWAPDPRFRPSTAEILRLTELWIQQTARGLLQWTFCE